MTLAIDPQTPEHNYVLVGPVQSPGRAQLTGVRTPYKWDIQQSYGREGATMIFRGRGVMKFTLTITLWLREHFLLWPLFAKAMEPPTLLKPFVFQMLHPLLSAADVKGVTVESFGQPERQQNGLWISTSEMLEYRPTKPILVRPRGSIPPVAGKPIAPKTEADKALVEAQQAFATARAAAR